MRRAALEHESMRDVPEWMLAQVIREPRLGTPLDAFRVERIRVPEPGPHEVLIRVMAAGVNPNGVWAALARPLNVIRYHRRFDAAQDYHVAGSDAAGVICRVGAAVDDWSVGDAVVVHGGCWEAECETIRRGGDPVLSPTMRAFGYQTPLGSFAQYTAVQSHQCLRKPAHLTWEEAASFMVSGATAYRMLRNWPPHTVEAGDVVLVWGAAGGLGSHALQIARAFGARPVAVVSNPERERFCRELGAVGCIDRTRFDHWGVVPDWNDTARYAAWLASVKAFERAIWDAVGARHSPRIVVEHPGQDTLPTSMAVCAPDGMVVTCAATSGFTGTFDLRSAWTWQKRLQGSHGMNDEQAAAVLGLVELGHVRPTLARVFAFEETALAHQMLLENRQPPGKLVVLVGAEQAGLGRRYGSR